MKKLNLLKFFPKVSIGEKLLKPMSKMKNYKNKIINLISRLPWPTIFFAAYKYYPHTALRLIIQYKELLLSFSKIS